MSDEGLTYDINGSFGATEKTFSINFIIAKTKFCLSLHYNGDISYFFFNGKQIYMCKPDNGKVDFPTHFCVGSISMHLVLLSLKKYL